VNVRFEFPLSKYTFGYTPSITWGYVVRITKDRTQQSSSHGVRGGKSWGVGWKFVHVCIDDASRIAFSRVMKDERKASAVAFLKAVVAYYASLDVTIERVMTDNGSCYNFAFRRACLVSSTSAPSPTPTKPTASRALHSNIPA
jgi:hypothetical protein